MFKKWFMAVLCEMVNITDSISNCVGAEPLNYEEFKVEGKQTYTSEQKSMLRQIEHCNRFGSNGDLSFALDEIDVVNNGVKFTVTGG